MSTVIPCDLCGKKFGRAAAVTSHKSAKHPNGRGPGVWCQFCLERATLYVSSAQFYGGTDFGPVWACIRCEAWVGCHRRTFAAKGSLANAELRRARRIVHATFDPIWQRGHATRSGAYHALADALGIRFEECHVAMFDIERCRQAWKACQTIGPELAERGTA